jgi:hypothetical protein
VAAVVEKVDQVDHHLGLDLHLDPDHHLDRRLDHRLDHREAEAQDWAHHHQTPAVEQQQALVCDLPSAAVNITAAEHKRPTDLAAGQHQVLHQLPSSEQEPWLLSLSSQRSGFMASTLIHIPTHLATTTEPRTETRPSLSNACAKSTPSVDAMRMATIQILLHSLATVLTTG